MKVLIIRFSSIGDIVLTSPVLRCIKEQVPDAEIHYLTKTVFSDLVKFNPHISTVHELKDELSPVLSVLKDIRFDVVIDLHNNLRSRRVKSALGVKSHAVQKENSLKWKMVNVRFMAKRSVPHIVERYLATARPLPIQDDGKGLELYIPADQEVALDTLPSTHRSGYVAFAIGAAHATKRMPVEQMVALCKEIAQPIVLIGGSDDQERASTIQMAIGPNVHDLTGKLSILRSASLIRQAKTVICHDSGAMHIACAFQKKTISIWGNTVRDFGFAPYQPNSKANISVHEVAGLKCRPCSKIGHNSCPKGHFQCMNRQDLSLIARETR